MVIYVKDHVASCTTNEDGEIILHKIEEAIANSGFAEVDFNGVTNATSSFVNSAFVPLLDRLRFEAVKRILKVKHAHPQIASMIRDRMSFEDRRIAA